MNPKISRACGNLKIIKNTCILKIDVVEYKQTFE
jgi:hypothetical protein